MWPRTVILIGTLGVFATCAAAAEPTQRPNIVYILSDDAGYGDFSCYGQAKFATPNIDRLAAEGMRFTQHYSGSTVCAPTRSSLMTGQHTGHTPIRGNKEHEPHGQEPLPDEAVTVAELLQDAGYATGCFGKWGLGYVGSEGDANAQGFDTFFGYNCQRWAHDYYRPWLDDNRERYESPEGEYNPEAIERRMHAFVRENRDRPFFLYFAATMPHARMQAPQAIYDRFKDNYPELDEDDPEARRKVLMFPAMMTSLDGQVGRLMALLKELGLQENTVVMFSSDNGPHKEDGHRPAFWNSSGGLRGIKRDLYEGGVRVPLIVRWPGQVAPGTTSDHVSAHWDFLPTVCQIVGIGVPDGVDGLSYVPEITGHADEQAQRAYLYWEFYAVGGRRAARFGNWKAVQNDLNTLGADAPIELYNLDNDISETHNLADKHPDLVARAREVFTEAHADPAIDFNKGKDVKPWF